MTNQEILDNAPEGATHVDEENDYFAFNARWRWNLWHDETKRFEATRATPTRSLADIKRIAELEQLACMDTLSKSLAIRDLELRECELMDFLDEVDTWSVMNTYVVAVDDFFERVKNLREQAKQLKEQGDD